MQLFRSARWLLPALLLSALPVFCHSQLFKGAALHLQSALWQATTPADAAPAAQPQAPEKAIANRKHLNVSVGPLRMHLPISGKRAVTPAATTTPTTSATEPQPQGLRIKGTNTGAAPRTEIQAKPAAPGQAGKASAGQGRIDPAVTVVNNGAPGSPSNIEAAHIEQPITFRWTPVLPNPQDPVTYRLSVWQLMVGQTGTQAIKVNPPILTKLVDEPNLAFRPDAVTGPCQSPHLCSFVWNVQALDRMGRPLKGYNDSQQVAAFQYDAQSGAFTVQQPNSPIINNEDAPGLKKQIKSTGQKQNQKQYILGVNLSFLMVAPPRGGGNQPGGAQPMATPGPSTSGVQSNQDPGVGPSPTQIDLEAGKLKQNPKYIQNRGTPQDGGNPPEHEQGRKPLDQAPVGSLSQSVLPTAQRTPGVPATNSPKEPQGISVINEGAPGAPSTRQENDKGSNTTDQPPAKVATQVKTTPQHRSSSNTEGGWAGGQSDPGSVGTVLPQQPKPLKPLVNMDEQPIGPVESAPAVPKGTQPNASARSLPAPGSGGSATQVDAEQGKLKQNPESSRVGANPGAGTNSNQQGNYKGSNTTDQPTAKVATQDKTTPQHRSASNNGGWATNQSDARKVGTVLPQQPKPLKPLVNMDEQPIGPVESVPAVPKGAQTQTGARSLPAPGSGTVKPQPAGYPITGVNILLPASPDAARKVDNSTSRSTATAKPNAVQPTMNQSGNASQQNRSQPKAAPKPQSQPAPKDQKPKK